MKPILKILVLAIFLLSGTLSIANNISEGEKLFKAGKYHQAINFYMKPDAQKDPDVLNRIGYMYNHGMGVEKNEKVGAEWYRKAAEMGYAKSQYNLGQCYLEGDGVPKDAKEAIKWFRMAAEQGYANAEYQMGYLTVKGKGTEQDFGQALKW